jgi:hypothetical protein
LLCERYVFDFVACLPIVSQRQLLETAGEVLELACF